MNPQWSADVAAPDTLVRAVYECISGPVGAPRDWDRFRFLHHPRAQSLRTVVNADGSTSAAVFNVEEYIANVEAFFADTDFFEIEVDRRIEIFGSVAHIWSVYEARPAIGSDVLIKRGANSLQLCYEHGRWWSFSTIWDNEREGLKFDLF